MSETILQEQEGRVAILTINRPDKLNALNQRVGDEVKAALDALASDDGIGVVVITGAGDKSFVAGADISEFEGRSPFDQRHAMRMILTGDMIGATEAKEIGLVELVVPHDDLRAKTLELAEKIASKSPLTAKVAKQAVRASHRLAIEEGLLYERDLFCLCFSTEDKKEGVAAFLEKRQAAWKGR